MQKGERGNFARHLIEVKIDSRLQRRENQFVAAERAKQRFAFERRNQAFFSNDDSGLRSPKQFVAAKTNKVGAILQSFRWRRLVVMQSDLFGGNERATSQVFHKRDALFSG